MQASSKSPVTLSRYPLWRILALAVLIISSMPAKSQKYWDGEGGDGLWSTAQNWSDNTIPQAGDEVILDNRFVTVNYMVSLPPVSTTVSIGKLRLMPETGRQIELIIPKVNTASPALEITGNGYSIEIQQGAILRNASGASSGAPLACQDSFAIFNGGRYIHQTPRSHAALVDRLSRASGTERGIFEFNVPSASSTISLSDRVYGSIELSADAAGTAVNYTAAATRKIIARGDLVVGANVRLNMNCADTFHIGDNLQVAGIVNLSTTNRSLVAAVGGNIELNTGAVITETGSVTATLLLTGHKGSIVEIRGSIENDVELWVDKSATVYSPRSFQLPSALHLLNGVLKFAADSVLTLAAASIVYFDASKSSCYIEANVRKLGLHPTLEFTFPVGARNSLHVLSVSQATGDLEVRYRREDPQSVSAQLHDVHRVSTLEFWTIQTFENSVPGMAVELYFPDGNHSGVTDMETLRVAVLKDDRWSNAGNAATTGTAGGSGSVLSNPISELTPSSLYYFTFASSTANQNPLPLSVSIDWLITGRGREISWTVPQELTQGVEFVVQGSMQPAIFTELARVWAVPGIRRYRHSLNDLQHYNTYRVMMINDSGDTTYTRQIALDPCPEGRLEMLHAGFRTPSTIYVFIEAPAKAAGTHAGWQVISYNGVAVARGSFRILEGRVGYTLPAVHLSRGLYLLQIVDRNGAVTVRRFTVP